MDLNQLLSLQDKVAVVTGGSGVLGSAMARALAGAGARVVIIGRRHDAAQLVADSINASGGDASALACDVLDKAALARAAATIGPVDILLNGAGGNQPGATTSPTQSFFDLDEQAIKTVFDVNYTGAVLASQVFARGMTERGAGVIINISSMSALRPLTRVAAYGAAKSALENFTKWLAVHLAQEYSPRIRVNAIAPGFFLTEQNRWLLTDRESGAWTERGQKIVGHTPMNRLGVADDLLGTLLWLASDASRFVTGIVVPVDGGFSAYAGV